MAHLKSLVQLIDDILESPDSSASTIRLAKALKRTVRSMGLILGGEGTKTDSKGRITKYKVKPKAVCRITLQKVRMILKKKSDI